MKKILLFIVLISGFIASAMAAEETFRLNVGQFDRLSVIDNLQVVYHCNPDSTGYAVYQADENMADFFLFTNTRGALKVQLSTSAMNYEGELPVVHLYSDYLTSVSNSSDKCLTIAGNASVPNFSAKLIGNGKIVAENIKASEVEANFVTGNGSIILSGVCGKAVYKMVGTGTIQADQMKAEIVNCKIMGSGSIGCWPLSRLDVRGIGSTKIYYKGDPQVKKVGGGKLFPLTEENGEEKIMVVSE